jgi:hypothetical protein
LGQIYLVGLSTEQECAVAALHDGDFSAGKKPVDRGFVDEALLQLIDGEPTRAASG